MDYKNTSHISSWNFTESQLVEIRAKANNRARHLLMKDFEKKIEQEKHQSNVNPAATGNDTSSSQSSIHSISTQLPVSFAKKYSKNSSDTVMDIDQDYANEDVEETEDLQFLSPTEEITLVHFYATKLFSLIGPNAQHTHLKRDIKIPSTAALLLRRFYLSNSVMIYDPKVFMVSCAFLASKIEDSTVDIRYLEEGTKMMKAHVTIPEIIKAEIQLAAGCDYDLLCLHPYRAIESYSEDLRTFLKTEEGRRCVNREWVTADLRPLYEEAKRIVEDFAVGDAPLIATAGKIGLASLKIANERLIAHNNKIEDNIKLMEVDEKKDAINIDFKGYLTMRFGTNHSADEIDKIWKDIEELCSISTMSKIVDDAADITVLKGIHKKLKKCRGGDEKKKKKKKRKREE